jgi:hypothetical protein
MNYDDILASLPQLNRAQLLDLRKRIGAFISLGMHASVINTPKELVDEDLCVEVIIEVVSLRGRSFISKEQFKGQAGYKRFQESVVNVMKFVREALPGAQRIEHRVVLHLGVRLLCENMAELNQPVTHGAVMRQFGRIPALYDRAFPGYARMGVLGIVVNREMQHVRP